ncbi:L-aspartate oxidase [Vineibacter terrae]|uniref:L-aspartate oxidase n=1 Tax=Vineibacter terrae TaxID=2586908 RepID=A0A5C8PD79_9HYPH|nr:L-aspartate oxidase [Vineibacter terrae]TXL71324.1 L-aspartate oxidase [Vineibacter terrae]
MSDDVSTRRAGVVVVGAGIGGLATALRLAPMPVTVLSAAFLGEGVASAWAQGGIAAACGDDDHPGLHADDTIAAAGGIADPAIVDVVTRAAPGCIDDLVALGVRFDRDAAGRLRLGREGGHHRHRIVHAAGDATGGEIMRALLAAARAAPSITLVEAAIAEEILVEDGRLQGVIARCGGSAVLFTADAVVLATGGLGGLYRHTSNPVTARGRGVALAARAGAVLADLEFVQFHPTALDIGRDPMPLVTEAVRGEGAVLVDDAGLPIMSGLHPLADLAPRDVVARAVWRKRQAGGRVYLDARAAVGAAFPERFPTVTAACRAAGIDPVAAPIPVAPAAHYHMGGVAVDIDGRSTLPGLWAVGEVAATGLHGANRLASNSLLEALVFANRLADDIKGTPPDAARRAPRPRLTLGMDVDESAAMLRLRHRMDTCVGVERDASGLRLAIDDIGSLRRTAASGTLADAALVAELVATAALRRCETRGGHCRVDHPDAAPAARSRLTLRDIAPAKTKDRVKEVVS